MLKRYSTNSTNIRILLSSNIWLSVSYVPLITPSTSVDRVKFLSGIADSFIYVVSRVSSRFVSARWS